MPGRVGAQSRAVLESFATSCLSQVKTIVTVESPFHGDGPKCS